MSSWGSCDFSELEKFAEKVDKLTQDIDTFEITMLHELAERTLKKVQQRTPVGQKPRFDEPLVKKVQGGDRIIQYRKNNRSRKQKGKTYTVLTKSGFIMKKYWNGYTGGTLKSGWQVGNIVRKDGYYEIEIFNNEPYASYVEYGHRQRPGRYVPALGKRLKANWVKGRFMMTISEQELKAQAPAIIEKRMRAFFEGAMP